MIKEFHKQLEENQDLSQLLYAIDQIPELPHIEYQPTLSQQELDQISEILNQLAKVRQDKLNINLIQEFHAQMLKFPKETTFYQSCLEQHNRHLKSLDYHSQHKLSNLSLNEINISTIEWLKGNTLLLPDLNQSILKKFQELVLYQLEQISIDFDQQKSHQTLFASNNIIVYKLDADIISLQLNSLISKQSEMIAILVGFLTFFDVLKIDLADFLINTISSKYRQYFIVQRNVIIDEVKRIDLYEKQIQQCLEKANLQEILEKQSHYNQIDQLKQNLIHFKDTYINLIEQLQFKQQKQQNWKLGFFKSKIDDTSKLPNQFFEHLLNDWKTLDKFIQNNSEKNEKQFQLIFDHLRLLDVCLDHKEITHNFQSLNFYVTIYSQIDEKLIKLLKHWTSNNDQLINFICNIKLKLRQYQLKANEFIDL